MTVTKFLSTKVLAAASVLGLLAATPAWAGFAQGNQVTMGGQPVFSIAADAFGYSADHRAWLAQDALDNALVVAHDRGPDAVTVGRVNGAIAVLLDGHCIASADENSANAEGLTADQLAAKWAAGIRNFLADSNRTNAYIASLTGGNAIGANVAIVERTLYAPSGTVLPVAFAMPLASDNLAAGQAIQGTLCQDVIMGDYMVPAQSVVSGNVTAVGSDGFAISFNTLRTPFGTTVPISAVLTGPFAASATPHTVATISMPYGEFPRELGVRETPCRVPAQIGIGSLGGGTERLVFRKGTNLAFVAGTPMAVMLGSPQQVAFVMRTTHVHM